mmetsp:Transcript_23880/g.74647  ORF Transcript_23880/g.74647 Transcript_23880/m.74647 type:complete len:361 (-) Transcript_23880:814-1896(-)
MRLTLWAALVALAGVMLFLGKQVVGAAFYGVERERAAVAAEVDAARREIRSVRAEMRKTDMELERLGLGTVPAVSSLPSQESLPPKEAAMGVKEEAVAEVEEEEERDVTAPALAEQEQVPATERGGRGEAMSPEEADLRREMQSLRCGLSREQARPDRKRCGRSCQRTQARCTALARALPPAALSQPAPAADQGGCVAGDTACVALRAAGPQRRLIVAMANSAFLEYAANWLDGLWAAGVRDFIIVAVDGRALAALSARAPGRVVPLPPGVMPAPGTREQLMAYMSDTYFELMRGVPKVIGYFLGLGIDVLYSDCDIRFLSDPWGPVLKGAEGKDIVAQVDGRVRHSTLDPGPWTLDPRP